MKPLTVLAMFLGVATPASARIVGACDDQYRELEYAAQRIGYEIRLQHRRVVADTGIIEGVGDAGLQDVIGEEKGNGESENQLGRFRERHLERTAQPERPERQAVMGGESTVEKDGAERRCPIRVDVLERMIHRLDRDEAEAVVDKVGRHVREHDEPRNQPQSPDHAFHPRSPLTALTSRV